MYENTSIGATRQTVANHHVASRLWAAARCLLLCLLPPLVGLMSGCVTGGVRTIGAVTFDPIDKVERAESPALPLVLAVRPPTGSFADKYNVVSEYTSASEVESYRRQWRRGVETQFPAALSQYLSQRGLFRSVFVISGDTTDGAPADLIMECELKEYQTDDNSTFTVDLLMDTEWHKQHTTTILADVTLRARDGQSWKFSPPKASATQSSHGSMEQGRAAESAQGARVLREFFESIAAEIEKLRPELASVQPRTLGPAGPATPPKSRAVANRWAVVIGISDYKHATKRLPDLKYAHRDAEQFAAFLKSKAGGSFPAQNVKLLTDSSATARNIRTALFSFLQRTVKEDLVIIYYAGHGMPDPGKPSNLYLVAHDSEPANIAATGIPMWDIETALKRSIAAERVVVFADACHSAGTTEGIRGVKIGDQFNAYFEALAKAKPGRVIFTSSEGYEVSREGKQWGGGHGVFTWALLEGLKGKADRDKNGIVTLGEVLDYVDITVRRETANEQHPTKAGVRFDRNLPMGVVK